MNPDVIAESDGLVQSGIAEQQKARFDDAGLYFFRALTCLDELPAAKTRRDQTRQLASLFLRAGHEDLALLAARDAVRLDEALKDRAILESDLLFYGNIHQRLGNIEEAKGAFEEAVDLCVQAGDFANAASASTNLALVAANSGDGKRAVALLSKSIEYLAKEPFPDTEFNTNAMMILVVHQHGGDPALAVKSGITLGQKYTDRLTEQYYEALVQPLREMVEAYLEEEPQPDPDAWKKQNLPWVYADAPGTG